MARRLNTFELAWAFIGPKIKSSIFKKSIPYWFFLDVTTACNKRCGYCYVIETKMKKVFERMIDFETAKKSIDYMYQKGCRHVAIMGGEPMLLGDTLVEIIEYATSKRMFTYLPTNLTLMSKLFLKKLIRAGICLIDVAIDSIEKRKGFDKNLQEINDQFEMVLKARKLGVYIKLNSVITRQNIDDIHQLVELSHKKGVPITLHWIDGPPPGTRLLQHEQYEWLQTSWHFTKEDYPHVEQIANWLIKKKYAGYWILNPVWYFEQMKKLILDGKHSGWNCTAGENTVLINYKGQFAPCLNLVCKQVNGELSLRMPFHLITIKCVNSLLYAIKHAHLVQTH
ncbi:MAG: Radical SAM domain protein [Parcubacteria group bacterium GW2011_GWA2_44_12]|nr:MAG: Radical SAM domain protein [Parcubacteria group bacterium GW2011_GWA2_44_12]